MQTISKQRKWYFIGGIMVVFILLGYQFLWTEADDDPDFVNHLLSLDSDASEGRILKAQRLQDKIKMLDNEIDELKQKKSIDAMPGAEFLNQKACEAGKIQKTYEELLLKAHFHLKNEFLYPQEVVTLLEEIKERLDGDFKDIKWEHLDELERIHIDPYLRRRKAEIVEKGEQLQKKLLQEANAKKQEMGKDLEKKWEEIEKKVERFFEK